jgi:hypothetical protein
MSDYKLTAGQQQQLVDFLNDGKGLYIGGNDFGYFNGNDPIYKMFGCTYLGDHTNITSLDGQADTLMQDSGINYAGAGYPDDYLDWFASDGGDLIFKCQSNLGRAVAYSGPDGSYRAIHQAFWFGAMKDAGATYTKDEIMAAYMNYLKGDTLVCGVADEIPASAGGDVNLMIETVPAVSGRTYGILGSRSGTSPGWNLGSVTVPLNKDNFTTWVHDRWNTNLLQNFRGTLDAKGRAIGTIHIGGPISSSHIGTTMNFAFVLLQPINQTSNPVEVQIVP